MEAFWEILKLFIPAAIVFLTAFYTIKKFLDREERERSLELRKNRQKQIDPIRLQAYERIILFLERISPNNLVMRAYKDGMSAKYLHSEMVEIIKKEFDHNTTQQIYISDQAWNLTKNAKEEIIKFLNTQLEKAEENANGIEFSKQIFNAAGKFKEFPTRVARDEIKKEVRKMF
ncbi:MAG: hypothetical protein ABEH43_04185 [Flavobacteriales bacterium]